MNNQGLDALAALAAAASHTPYPNVASGRSTSNTGGSKDETMNDKHAKSSEAAPPHVPPQAVNPSVPDFSAQQQWQQAIANAASSIGAMAAGPNGQNNLALLGMQQQLNQANVATNPNMLAIQQQLAMQQQLNYYQLLAHAATQQQRQFGANQVMNAATVPGTSTAAQALSQVLGVHSQTPYPNVNGTFRFMYYHFVTSEFVQWVDGYHH